MAQHPYEGIVLISTTVMVLVWTYASLSYAEPFYDITKHKNYHLLPVDTCGDNSADRIIGGQVAALGEFPWMVQVGYKLEDCPAPEVFRCGGALITENWVLTAAHCITELPINMCPKVESFHNYFPSLIRLGEHSILTDPDCEQGVCAEKVQDIPIQKCIHHESFGNPYLRHDIGLIRLSRPATLNAWVNTLCMIPGERASLQRFAYQTGIVAGWGIINPQTKVGSQTLMKLRVPIVDFQQCVDTYAKIVNLSRDHQLCAGGIKGQDSCLGDSGGPMFIVDDTDQGPRFHILGIISFGFKRCADSPVPAIYTNVLYYADWILDRLN